MERSLKGMELNKMNLIKKRMKQNLKILLGYYEIKEWNGIEQKGFNREMNEMEFKNLIWIL